MADRAKGLLNKVLEWWNKFTAKQKTILASATAGIIVTIAIIAFVLTRPQFVVLANCESTKEASQITELLDANGLTYRVSDDALQIKILKDQQSDAELYERQRKAEAEKFEQEREADAMKAKAEAQKFSKEQEAAGIRMVGEAEAEAIRAKGLAEAEAMEKKAEAYQKYNNAAMAEMLIKVLPDIAGKIAEPLTQIDKITIIGGDGQTNGVSSVADNVPAVMAKLFETMKETVGIDLADIVKAGTYDAKVNRNINITTDGSEEGEALKDGAVAASAIK